MHFRETPSLEAESIKDALQQMASRSSKEAAIRTNVVEHSSDQMQTPVKSTLLRSSGDGEQKRSVYICSNGLQFSSVEEVLKALDAALEVNEHLRQQVEEKGSLALSLGAQLEASESRHERLLAVVHSLERRVSVMMSPDDMGAGKKMSALLKQGVTTPTRGFWESDMVCSKRNALLNKGAQQGWLMNAFELQIGECIGQGSFGETFEACWRGTRVAVKSAAVPESSTEALNVLREIECFSSIHHPNVLAFLGACLSDSERCLLVTEFMSGGSLKDWIHGAPGTRKQHRKLSERLTKALHIAQGMAGLEGEDPPIVHRDLKPSNVLLDDAGIAHIADMNLSLRLSEDSLAMLTGETGTYLYMSPEMMRHETYTTKTDVWSFGVMLVELCSQQVPYSSLFLTPLQVAIGVADRGLRPPIETTDIPIHVRQMVDKCLAQDPSQRPSFVALVSQLKEIVHSVVAAEERADSTPSLLSRMSQGLGMLQSSAPQQTGKATEACKSRDAGSRSNESPPHVMADTELQTCEGTKSSPHTPQTIYSSSNGSQRGMSFGLPPAGLRRSIGAGQSVTGSLGSGPGIGGGAAGDGAGAAAQILVGGAQAAAGKASAMFAGFLHRARPSPRH